MKKDDERKKREELHAEIRALRDEKVDLERRISDRRQAERSIRLFKTVTDNANYGVSICSLDGKISYINKAFADMHGYSQDELIDKDLFFLHPKEEMQAMDEVLVRLRKQGSITAVETLHKKKDGTFFPMIMNASVIKNNQGKDLFLSTIVVDIAEHKEAEKALKESEEKWVSLVQNAPSIIIIADRDGKIQFINAHDPGYKPENIIGNNIYEYILPEYHDIARSKIEYVFETGQTANYESMVARPDKTIWYDTQVGPLKKDEEIVAVTLIATEITERKKAEKALQESEQKYRLITENARDFICIMKLNGAYTFLSPSHRLLGYTNEELIGKSGFDLLHMNDKIRLLPLLEKYARLVLKGTTMENMRDAVEHLEFRVVDKSGNWHDMESTASLVRSLSGKGYDVLLISRDVTERKRSAEALRESEARFRTIFDNATDGIVLADIKTKKIATANKIFCKMLGYNLEEVKRLTVKDVHPKDAFADVIKQFEKQIRKEITLAPELPVKRKDGSIFFADVSARPVTVSGQECLMGIFRDTTERKQAKEALEESEEKLRSIFDNANDGICLADLEEKKIFMANKMLCRMMGYTEEELKALKIENMYPEEERAFSMDQLKRAWAGEVTRAKEIPVERKDGSTFYSDINCSVITLGGKKYLIGIFRDMTESKYLEEALRNSETLYRTIFENTGTSAVIIEGDMTVLMANDEFVKFSGYSRKEVQDWGSFLKFIKSDQQEKMKEFHRLRRIDPEAAPRNYELQVVNKRGRVKDVYITVAIIPGTDRSLASFTDITEMKRNETELNKQKELLDNTNKALEHKLSELQEAMKHIKKLEGIVPICANCKKMLTEGGNPKSPNAWVSLEEYISERTDASFSHGLCPECIKKMYGDRLKDK